MTIKKNVEIEIELDVSQRFWIESESDGQLLLVSKITINPWGNIINFEGKSFSIDYESMSIQGESAAHMNIDYTERAFFEED
ncbi:hypothetical protein [Paenibacillus sp. Marseille-Q4541]|uniref:hypothetical protein n=1 Tax=Paenibacillus sp. Marseille-Q4541 TaxID=2831522 RepID=UPI001BA7A9FD|nr:hypothetical protein [Paenibacillus sp. Marseille-Q4541]